ncbi:pseudaminic acid cytidylyltransferase [Marinomonas sp. M1K-6]|uniref:Pseudaminic acid cytidylyltransferase n=1 Tax=Marinomonas profundi TaxID=2726122 RepID=A0A847RCP4_9GAMM|nr:pseudaminic acid cytidylyltransferase [Marinomonas profundi]NLQ18794.1 pseudaminic acid cytidylyltransferase [Marinomonas profundi]UDV02272.1 pseudaminic acid cytidylyltransferase [Marinomonas profundi]
MQDSFCSQNSSRLQDNDHSAKRYRVAVIPARGGSQRIPRKNIRLLDGKPLIAYSIETAMASGLFDRVIVSTDDTEIADVARQFGAETPFLRPADLADHMTGTTPVMQHALRFLSEEGKTPDEGCLIYATCPLLTPKDLQQGLAQLDHSTAFCFSATTFAFPIQRALHLNDKGDLAPMFPEHIGKRSQDLVEAIHDAGQFYWASTQSWFDQEIFGPQSKPLLLPRHRIQDLDTEEDWLRLTQIMLLKQAADLNL